MTDGKPQAAEKSTAKSEKTTKKTNIWASRYKTKMCEKYEKEGTCPYGFRCMFAHGQSEMRDKEMNFRDQLITETAVKQHQKKQQQLHQQQQQQQQQPTGVGIPLNVGVGGRNVPPPPQQQQQSMAPTPTSAAQQQQGTAPTMMLQPAGPLAMMPPQPQQQQQQYQGYHPHPVPPLPNAAMQQQMIPPPMGNFPNAQQQQQQFQPPAGYAQFPQIPPQQMPPPPPQQQYNTPIHPSNPQYNQQQQQPSVPAAGVVPTEQQQQQQEGGPNPVAKSMPPSTTNVNSGEEAAVVEPTSPVAGVEENGPDGAAAPTLFTVLDTQPVVDPSTGDDMNNNMNGEQHQPKQRESSSSTQAIRGGVPPALGGFQVPQSHNHHRDFMSPEGPPVSVLAPVGRPLHQIYSPQGSSMSSAGGHYGGAGLDTPLSQGLGQQQQHGGGRGGGSGVPHHDPLMDALDGPYRPQAGVASSGPGSQNLSISANPNLESSHPSVFNNSISQRSGGGFDTPMQQMSSVSSQPQELRRYQPSQRELAEQRSREKAAARAAEPVEGSGSTPSDTGVVVHERRSRSNFSTPASPSLHRVGDAPPEHQQQQQQHLTMFQQQQAPLPQQLNGFPIPSTTNSTFAAGTAYLTAANTQAPPPLTGNSMMPPHQQQYQQQQPMYHHYPQQQQQQYYAAQPPYQQQAAIPNSGGYYANPSAQ